jgi:hypothetical protein
MYKHALPASRKISTLRGSVLLYYMKYLSIAAIALLLLYIFLCLFGCSPERRMSRLVKKHPELLTKDTLRITDTLITKGTLIDSTFYFTGDTIYIHDSILTIKYFYNNETQKHYIEGKVKPDTIIKEIKIPYDRVVVKNLNWWQENKDWIILVLPILVVLGMFYRKK